MSTTSVLVTVNDSSSSTYKHPVFDGSDDSKFRNWWDHVKYFLEMEDIDEYIEEAYKNVPMPTKDETTVAANVTDTQVVAEADNKKTIRKEMKKAKAHMARVSDEFPHRLIVNASTPYEAYVALKSKYYVSEADMFDFFTLDREWNEFKVQDKKTDPDKIFSVLEEHSKKLGEFGKKYEKDALQMLSKIHAAMPADYDHVFTVILQTDEEHNKSYEVQLETTKRMIKSHYKRFYKVI